ncbi:MAG: hypothetical protein LBD57_04345 [Endomicrobium sp.]|uniref:hypothetical protein n=1 Tax=Candidatus Endomicrobiellum cubanum TaxID=3242325 RepID=UPI00282E928F|nr:hypothetical protein [Endomicrobium sp.]
MFVNFFKIHKMGIVATLFAALASSLAGLIFKAENEGSKDQKIDDMIQKKIDKLIEKPSEN